MQTKQEEKNVECDSIRSSAKVRFRLLLESVITQNRSLAHRTKVTLSYTIGLFLCSPTFYLKNWDRLSDTVFVLAADIPRLSLEGRDQMDAFFTASAVDAACPASELDDDWLSNQSASAAQFKHHHRRHLSMLPQHPRSPNRPPIKVPAPSPTPPARFDYLYLLLHHHHPSSSRRPLFRPTWRYPNLFI